MSSRNFYEGAKSLTVRTIKLYGSITMNGDGDDIASQFAEGFAVARNGVGDYQIQLENHYVQFLSAVATIETQGTDPAASPSTLVRNVVVSQNGTPPTIDLINWQGAAAADYPADSVVHFEITLGNSSVKN